jgi:hypothetical protein
MVWLETKSVVPDDKKQKQLWTTSIISSHDSSTQYHALLLLFKAYLHRRFWTILTYQNQKKKVTKENHIPVSVRGASTGLYALWVLYAMGHIQRTSDFTVLDWKLCNVY